MCGGVAVAPRGSVRFPARSQVHHHCRQHLVNAHPPQGAQKIRRPHDLIGQRRDGQARAHPLKAPLLPMQRQAIVVLVDHQGSKSPEPAPEQDTSPRRAPGQRQKSARAHAP